MKQLTTLFFALIIIYVSDAQNVGIGTTTPAASAILDATSTTQGFLPPRMTIAQRNAIANAAIGLVIFCTECDELEVYNGTIWKSMRGTAACISPSLPSVTICNQIWMQKNLDVSTYRNGDNIPQETDPTAWASLTTGAWCWYNNDSASYASTYGKLYNWYAVNDSRGLAPLGWHVPSDSEWLTLGACLGGDSIAGGKMKEAGTVHWLSPNTGADNSSGFTGLPAGYISDGAVMYGLDFLSLFWSSTETSTDTAVYYFFNNNSSYLYRNNLTKKHGFSVRCLRD
jgi:uncharacterized protein (TIGR02145 family)